MSLQNAKWDLIPTHMRDGVRRWVENGIAPGHFLKAVICNDLKEALGRADDLNRARLFDYVSFFYSYAPIGCWGSPEKFDEWKKAGGLAGLEARRAKEEALRDDELNAPGPQAA